MQRVERTAGYVCVEYTSAAPAFACIFLGKLTMRQIVGLAYAIGQPAVDESGGSAAQFLAPRPVLDLGPENVFQAAG
jgi:hypothetical protein